MISTQFLQNCQAGDEEAIETLVRTHQRGVFQLALSILDNAPIENESKDKNGAGDGKLGPDSSLVSARTQAAISISEAAAEAEFATRETFTAALDRLGRYREEISFTTWLYGIALDISRRRMRRWKLRKFFWKIAGRHVNQAWNSVAYPLQQDQSMPVSESLFFLPGDLQMWSAVRSLDEKLRIPIVLHYYHEFPIHDIALLMHLSEGAVHARLDAAREKIARSLEK